MGAIAIRIANVTKRFGAQTARDTVSAKIESGLVTGLVGPDGAGQTTLIRLIAGLLLPDEGAIEVLGFDTRENPPAVQNEISYMPQRFGLYEDLTVQENLNLYADLRGLPLPERKETFERLLAFTALQPFTRRYAGKLSGDMKQKLGLDCALIRTPRVLLLDEPSLGVDPISRRELWRMVQEFKGEGIAVIWSTAYLDEAEKCDRTILLSGGRPLHRGPPEELTRHVEGRSFKVLGLKERRREALSRALETEGVIDGVIQSSAIRIVTARPPEGGPAALRDRLGRHFARAEVEAAEPRFEDAFVDALGGAPGGRSELAESVTAKKGGDVVIEASGLTKKFGDFTAARGRLGYMAQKFSLYGDLSVSQNLDFLPGSMAWTQSAGARRPQA